MPDHDVAALSAAELAAARRELAASLALARPGSPVRMPIQARMAAIDAELAGRAAARPGLPGSPRARPPDGGPRGLRRDAPAPRCRGVLVPGAGALSGISRDIRWRTRSDGLCLWPSSGS
jgi:hypothetical protein